MDDTKSVRDNLQGELIETVNYSLRQGIETYQMARKVNDFGTKCEKRGVKIAFERKNQYLCAANF